MTRRPHPTDPTASIPRFTPRARVALLSAAATVASLVLLGWFGPLSTFRLDPPATMALLLVGFVVAERMVFFIELENEAVAYTPSEIVLAVGLLVLGPHQLVAVRVLGVALGMMLARRRSPIKLIFNLSHTALETALALLLFDLIRAEVGTSVLGSWFSIVASLIVASIFGAMVVAVAIAQFEGDLLQRLRQELTNGPKLYLPVVGVGASIAVPMTVDPRLGAIAAVPAPIIWLGLRVHGSLQHRHNDLVGVHDFSRHLGESIDLASMASIAAEHIETALRAEFVALRIWSESGATVDAGGGDWSFGILPDTTNDSDWRQVLADDRLKRSSDLPPRLQSGLADTGLLDAIVAPINDESGTLGVMVISGRLGATASFDGDDLDRLTSMIHQLSLATRKERLRTQMQFDATHDRLTSLPNRSHFELLVNDAGTAGDAGAVLLIDLDRFKQINDAFGHRAGDRLLVEAARRIAVACVIDDAVARFGGDEFAVFMPHVSTDEALIIAAAVSEWLERPFDVESADVAVGASIGIALMPEHGRDASSLLRCADIAMYDAKSRRTRASLFRPSLDKTDNDRATLLNDLRAALRDHQISVHFQPQIDVTTRQISGAEALARWEHPSKGRIDPGEFIALAEQAGLIEELTRQVLVLACGAASRWHELGFAINVAVNISPQSLLDERLGLVVEAALRSTTIDPRCLMLEITETTMMAQDERAHRVIEDLSRLGVQMSVDDFGTGFSSLVNLRHLPLNEIKIDRSFVSTMLTEHDDEVIVRSTIELGHNLGLSVVAEGVETDAVFDRLAMLGCDFAQGFGISRAMPGVDFEAWLVEHGHEAVTVSSEVQPLERSVVGDSVDSST